MTKKFIYPIATALAVLMASTGCKHTVPVTPLPNPSATGNQPAPMAPGPALNPGNGAGSSEMAEPQQFDPSKWDQDRDALAANTIHFPFDSAVIPDSEKGNLQAVAGKLNSDATASLLIEGDCDERGTEEYNRSLGERRAEAAREALAGMGISVNRIYTTSYGKDKPVDAGHDEAAWSKNRRDDFVLLHPKAGT